MTNLAFYSFNEEWHYLAHRCLVPRRLPWC